MGKVIAILAASMIAAGNISAVNQFDISVNKPGADIAPTMYGVFFEDINFGADGGLYAEMVKNRSFEFPNPLMGWYSSGKVTVKSDGPFSRNPHYVTLENSGHKEKGTGIDNEGYFGISFVKDSSYRFSVYARASKGKKSRIIVELVDPASDGETQVCARVKINVITDEWTKYEVNLSPDKTVEKGRLRIFLDSGNPVDLEHVSLFPVDTYNGHENGLRRDLAELLADIKPGVFRFPGGCIVEGTDLATRYQWKNTVGPVENRPLNENRWHYTFHHRYFPDYYQSNGLGFYEYFLLSEEIGAAPLPVLNVGMACQYQNKSLDAHVPVDELDPYVQDAVDLIEFANGDTTTVWGALRSSMGHPEPFGLEYLAIGNEQWGPEYVERLKVFIDTLGKVHPEIKIVGSSGPAPDGDKFDYLWDEMKKLNVDLVDEHYYRPEEWFLSQGMRYDNYDRKSPKVFAGEYACHTKGHKRNNFDAALCEAAFMTGLERNADVVRMATYAPLFAHVDGWQWRPDMIWFDNMRSVPTVSYYVQKLYGNYKGTHVLPLTMDGKPVAGQENQNGLFASAAVDKPTGDIIIKVANTSAQSQEIKFNIKGLKKGRKLTSMRKISLHSDDSRLDNTLDNPDAVKPVEVTENIDGNYFSSDVPAKTFQVIVVSCEQ